MGIGCTRSRRANLREAGVYGVISNWGEVVTRYPYRKVGMDHLLYREIYPKVESGAFTVQIKTTQSGP